MEFLWLFIGLSAEGLFENPKWAHKLSEEKQCRSTKIIVLRHSFNCLSAFKDLEKSLKINVHFIFWRNRTVPNSLSHHHLSNTNVEWGTHGEKGREHMKGVTTVFLEGTRYADTGNRRADLRKLSAWVELYQWRDNEFFYKAGIFMHIGVQGHLLTRLT